MKNNLHKKIVFYDKRSERWEKDDILKNPKNRKYYKRKASKDYRRKMKAVMR